MAATKGNGPVGTASNQVLVDSGTLLRHASPQCGPAGMSPDEHQFETAFDLLKAELANAGFIASLDGAARVRYDQLLQGFRDEILARVRTGEITWEAAAAQAQGMRDDAMQLIRGRSSPVGQAVAQWLKPNGRTLNELIAKKSIELFGSDAVFARLGPSQQNRVYAAIVASAGKSNPIVTARMLALSRAGRGLLVLSLGVSVYTVATAQNKAVAAAQEGAITGAGIAGGVAGGALAGLACGPGAPVCVTVGAFVGGAAAAFGVGLFWK